MPKKMTSISEQLAKHLFVGQITQQLTVKKLGFKA